MRGQRIRKDMSRDLLLCVSEGAENMLLWCYVLVRWQRICFFGVMC